MFPKEVGIEPDNCAPTIIKSRMFVKSPKVEGILPVKGLLLRLRYSSDWMLPNSDGIEPLS